MSANFQSGFWDQLKFNADGLIPAIIQDYRSGRVLMMAWMNEASIQMSLETGKTHFWSRSRKKFWMKGESSGHTQTIQQIAFDCDGDALLIQVEQVGAACHQGYFSCFYRSADARNQIVILEKQLRKPEEIYGKKRLVNNPEKPGKQDAQPKETKDERLGAGDPPAPDRTQSRRSRLPLPCGAMFLAFALQCPAAVAQTASGKVSGGWRMPLMENGKLKTLLVGSGAETLADGRFRISEVAIQIYDDQIPPQPRLLIDAPECFFDMDQRQASSAGPISLREANGNYSIQGLGFSWMQSTSNLSISNNVRTIISRPAAEQNPDEPASDSALIEVRADRFDYDRTSNVGTYRGRVKAVQGSRFQLSCDQVKVLLPDEKRDARTIEAQGNVQIEFQSEEQITVLVGERARYQTANSGETLQLRGDPFWRADDYEGRGNEIDVENLDTAPAFTVRGDAQMTMPAVAPSQEALASNPPKVQLRAGSYTYLASESKVLFLGGVQAHSAGKWSVESQRLTAFIQPESRTLQRIIAEEQVRVTRTAGDEVTQTAGSVIIFTPLGPRRSDIVIEGKARFAGQDFSAQGDRIHLRQNNEETAVSAAGNVQVKLLRFTAPGGGILSLAQAPKVASAQKSELLIIANKANLASGKGRFEGDVVVKDAKGTMKSQTLDILFGKTLRSIQNLKVSGNVQVRHADGKLACRQLIGDFSGSSNVLRRLTASGAVEIQNVHGTAAGRRAIYFADKGWIELSGDARLRARIASSQGLRNVRATADLLLWDQIQNTFQARGKFRSLTLP